MKKVLSELIKIAFVILMLSLMNWICKGETYWAVIYFFGVWYYSKLDEGE